jgi:hypothetical protein
MCACCSRLAVTTGAERMGFAAVDSKHRHLSKTIAGGDHGVN